MKNNYLLLTLIVLAATSEIHAHEGRPFELAPNPEITTAESSNAITAEHAKIATESANAIQAQKAQSIETRDVPDIKNTVLDTANTMTPHDFIALINKSLGGKLKLQEQASLDNAIKNAKSDNAEDLNTLNSLFLQLGKNYQGQNFNPNEFLTGLKISEKGNSISDKISSALNYMKLQFSHIVNLVKPIENSVSLKSTSKPDPTPASTINKPTDIIMDGFERFDTELMKSIKNASPQPALETSGDRIDRICNQTFYDSLKDDLLNTSAGFQSKDFNILSKMGKLLGVTNISSFVANGENANRILAQLDALNKATQGTFDSLWDTQKSTINNFLKNFAIQKNKGIPATVNKDNFEPVRTLIERTVQTLRYVIKEKKLFFIGNEIENENIYPVDLLALSKAEDAANKSALVSADSHAATVSQAAKIVAARNTRVAEAEAASIRHDKAIQAKKIAAQKALKEQTTQETANEAPLTQTEATVTEMNIPTATPPVQTPAESIAQPAAFVKSSTPENAIISIHPQSINPNLNVEITNALTSLSLKPGATLDQINAAFRRAVLQYHPDKTNNNPIATEKFNTISAAKDLLTKHLNDINETATTSSTLALTQEKQVSQDAAQVAAQKTLEKQVTQDAAQLFTVKEKPTRKVPQKYQGLPNIVDYLDTLGIKPIADTHTAADVKECIASFKKTFRNMDTQKAQEATQKLLSAKNEADAQTKINQILNLPNIYPEQDLDNAFLVQKLRIQNLLDSISTVSSTSWKIDSTNYESIVTSLKAIVTSMGTQLDYPGFNPTLD